MCNIINDFLPVKCFELFIRTLERLFHFHAFLIDAVILRIINSAIFVPEIVEIFG